MNEFGTDHPSRQTAFYALAILGFIAMVSLGVWLAVYSAQFVPIAMTRLGAAAVSLSEVFNRGPVTPGTTATTTPSTPTATSTPQATTTPSTGTPVSPSQPVAGQQTNEIVPIGGGVPSAPYGLPDLIVTIEAVGYLTTASTESFVNNTTVPSGFRPAVKFTVKNVGTNIASAWRFSAIIPSPVNSLYISNLQQQLGPGDYVEYTLGFDQPNRGEQTLTVAANYDRTVGESNTNNNNASAKLTIQ